MEDRREYHRKRKAAWRNTHRKSIMLTCVDMGRVGEVEIQKLGPPKAIVHIRSSKRMSSPLLAVSAYDVASRIIGHCK